MVEIAALRCGYCGEDWTMRIPDTRQALIDAIKQNSYCPICEMDRVLLVEQTHDTRKR